MGPFIALLCLGCMLSAIGALLMIMAIPFTSWDAPWKEIKESFSVMVHRRSFQAGLICMAVGLLILLCTFMR